MPAARRGIAHRSQVGGVGGDLEVDDVGGAVRADGAVQLHHPGLGQCDRLAAFALRAPREKQRHAGSLPDASRRFDHAGGIADRLEEVDPPLQQVGRIAGHGGHFGQQRVGVAAHQRHAHGG